MSGADVPDGPAIEVRNIWKVFGAEPAAAMSQFRQGSSRSDVRAATGCTVAVGGVSFAVAPGETFVVMGLSGSGKSTLVRCLSRLIDPTAGEVLVNGQDLLAMNDNELREVRRSTMAMVFQHFGLFPHRDINHKCENQRPNIHWLLPKLLQHF